MNEELPRLQAPFETQRLRIYILKQVTCFWEKLRLFQDLEAHVFSIRLFTIIASFAWMVIVYFELHSIYTGVRLWTSWQFIMNSTQSPTLKPTGHLVTVAVGGGQRSRKEYTQFQEYMRTANSLWSHCVGIEPSTLYKIYNIPKFAPIRLFRFLYPLLSELSVMGLCWRWRHGDETWTSRQVITVTAIRIHVHTYRQFRVPKIHHHLNENLFWEKSWEKCWS